jgi:hypothetical protein
VLAELEPGVGVLSPAKPLGLLDGVAFSFWAAFSLPLLLLQLLYKLVWLFAVALPLWSAGQWDALDILVMPWAYVVANYVRKPGESWKLAGVFGKASPQPSGRT